MCGISGVIGGSAGMVEPAVRRMMRAMVHRGPDDEGYEEFARDAGAGRIGFGFRRLAILDLSPAGHQPMFHPETGDCLIFNGEIYNYRAIRSRLQMLGSRFRSSGDTEVLLHALATWGEQALDEVDGMFALAFYHAATQRVLLARDHLGIKPLYVASTGGSLVFASEVRALLASGMVSGDLDPAGIASFLAYGAPQDPLTIHRHVRSFPAASWAWVDPHATLDRLPVATRYWRFPAVADMSDAAGCVADVRACLAEAVREQCVADVPLGVFLSGGIDSATMAALARSPGRAVQTFAVGFESAGEKDEAADAAATAHALGANHFQTILDDDWLLSQWSQWLKAIDRPSIDGLNTYAISGAVSDRGITVSLSGLGGDEIFGGYPSFRRVPLLRRMLAGTWWLPQRLRGNVAEVFARGLPASQREKIVDQVSGSCSLFELAVHSRRLSSNATLTQLGLDAGRLGLTPTFLPAEAIEPFRTTDTDSFGLVSQVESLLYMGNTLLRDADINSMAHSLEIRVPFLSRRCVEVVGALPGRIKAPPGGAPKHLLREAMRSVLPAEVFSRPKRGFTLPFRQWMAGPLRDECEAAVEEVANCDIFAPGSIKQLWGRYMGDTEAHQWARPLALVVLGNYLRNNRRFRSISGEPGIGQER